MNIFFIYDSAYCKGDEHDPKDAVIYFYPPQAAESDHYFLCCQLAGVAKFLRRTFSSPTIISLEHRKFAFLWSGDFLLVLGSVSDTNTNVLLDQLSFLNGIFCFYHKSISNMFQECKSRDEFIEKMEMAWSRYVTLSQCFGNVLQLSLKAQLMKSKKKNVACVAMSNRLLHMCQMSACVVAGAVFQNSKVVSSQFPPQITSFMCLLSNSNASIPVGNMPHNFDKLPVDVELKHIYLSQKTMSSILKYNHLHVGTCIRVKSANRSLSNSLNGISSGSEGDIDSGTCSENIPSSNLYSGKLQHSKLLMNRGCNTMSTFQKLLKYGTMPLCCTFHMQTLMQFFIRSRNQNCTFLPSDLDIYRDDKFFQESNLKKQIGYLSGLHNGSALLICKTHSNYIASHFVSECNTPCSNINSSYCFEFSCPYCKNYVNNNFSPISFKKWNSDPELSICVNYTVVKENKKSQPSASVADAPKLQVLKCRMYSPNYNRTKHRFAKGMLPSNHSKLAFLSSYSSPNSVAENVFHLNSTSSENSEKDKLQKHVLYVQRYANGTLLLLLNKHYDGNSIQYLWNCGFTILRDMERNTGSLYEQKTTSSYIDPAFYILLYNNEKKTLREFPHHPFVILNDKNSRETMQQIQEDFHLHNGIHSLNLLSSNQSIFASKKDEHFVLYLQLEHNSPKLESLHNLSLKAVRRIQKYFNIAF